MMIRNIPWGYWITLVLPCVGGLVVFLGLATRRLSYLSTALGTFRNEVTWMGFVQITSESLAVAYAAWLTICPKIWQLLRLA